MTAIPILMYHHVAPPPAAGHPLRKLYVSPTAFARQIRLLQLLGYRGLSMSKARPYLRGERSGKVAVITLDDGYADNLYHALPTLQRYGCSATCYAVSAAPGGYNRWDEELTGTREPLMDVTQLRQWQAAGMEVGAHTRSHAHLTRCTAQVLSEQVHGCKAELEDALGVAVPQFCYPYGDFDERVVAVVRAAGYTDATTTARGRARPGGDRWRWPRVRVFRREPVPRLAMRLLSQYEDHRA